MSGYSKAQKAEALARGVSLSQVRREQGIRRGLTGSQAAGKPRKGEQSVTALVASGSLQSGRGRGGLGRTPRAGSGAAKGPTGLPWGTVVTTRSDATLAAVIAAARKAGRRVTIRCRVAVTSPNQPTGYVTLSTDAPARKSAGVRVAAPGPSQPRSTYWAQVTTWRKNIGAKNGLGMRVAPFVAALGANGYNLTIIDVASWQLDGMPGQ